MKNYNDESKTQKKINVKKIVTMSEVLNRNFDELKFKIKSINELSKLKKLSKEGGKTKITFQISDDQNDYTFVLNDKRNEIVDTSSFKHCKKQTPTPLRLLLCSLLDQRKLQRSSFGRQPQPPTR